MKHTVQIWGKPPGGGPRIALAEEISLPFITLTTNLGGSDPDGTGVTVRYVTMDEETAEVLNNIIVSVFSGHLSSYTSATSGLQDRDRRSKVLPSVSKAHGHLGETECILIFGTSHDVP